MIADKNLRPDYDPLFQKITDYIFNYKVTNSSSLETARLCLLDSMGCAMLALQYQNCKQLLGPMVPNTFCEDGVKVFGTDYVLEPTQAAFNITTTIRYLDYNDTFLAAEWGHPSDNIGAILAATIYQQNANNKNYTMQDISQYIVKAYEIQGVIALQNSFNAVGLDHVILVKLASAAVCGHILGASKEQLLAILSQCMVDGQSLRTYRHAPNTGSRKSWAAADAAKRALELCFLTLKGESGYPSAISAQKWGFSDVLFKGKAIVLQREFTTYIIDNILFKISYPAEFHAQTAVEAAILLHNSIKDKLKNIKTIHLFTQESAVRIINKAGPLYNYADRDHSLQYMVAIGLLYGELTAKHYQDDVAANPQIDALREKMQVVEDKQYTKDYLDENKRSIANAIVIEFNDGSKTDKVEIHYPLGHKNRREEGLSHLQNKFNNNILQQYPQNKLDTINNFFAKNTFLDQTLADFYALF